MKEFDIEKLARKNIYKVPDCLFENIQGKVMNDVKPTKKAPIFKLNFGYAVAASLVLIFGVAFVFNQNNDSTKEIENSRTAYAENTQASKTESEIAYETLKSDVTSAENNNQKSVSQYSRSFVSQKAVMKEDPAPKITKSASKKPETQMNEYLDSFSNSEISELASNSTQDVYLDLYN